MCPGYFASKSLGFRNTGCRFCGFTRPVLVILCGAARRPIFNESLNGDWFGTRQCQHFTEVS